MTKYKIFIDGSNGTTGLEIHKRLMERDDIELVLLPDDQRKDLASRKEMVIYSDLSILCLPDEASKALVMEVGSKGRILDASTAYRTNPQWVYGLPELIPGQRKEIESSSRVSVPGCHASGFILLVRPLIEKNISEPSKVFTGFSMTGYSGGGKAMIRDYEEVNGASLKGPGQYGLTQEHKHLPEIKAMAKLNESPVLIPVVANYYRGMAVTIPLPPVLSNKNISKQNLIDIYKDYYNEESLIEVKECDEGFIYGDEKAGKDDLTIYVYGSEEHPVVSAVYDNLGKGASGAAVQCMNLMLGIKETKSLVII